VSSQTAHQDYQFVLEEEGQALRRTVRCRSEMSSDATKMERISVTTTSQRLFCGLWSTAEPAQFGRLDFRDGKGRVELGRHALGIEPRDMLGREVTVDPAGYALTEGGRDLAVVQVVNGGAAWIAPGLDADSRSLVAMSAAALLLYRAPSP